MIDLKNLKLVVGRNPILLQEAEKFDFDNPPCDPMELASAMMKIMEDQKGMGLSACQVGLPYAAFVVSGEPYACFNPKIVHFSDEKIVLDEGCLSFPGLMVSISRSRHIRLRYTGPNGVTETKHFTGMTARVIQHEMDHLNGVLFYNYLPLYTREKVLRQFTKGMKYAKSSQHSESNFFAPLEHAAVLLEKSRSRTKNGTR